MAKVTIKTIANEAGVSIATVSKALNDMPDISESVKQQVRAIAARQGYRINVAARQLAQGKSNTIGVILPDISQHNVAQVYKTLSNRLQKEGYTLLLGNSEGDLKSEAAWSVDMMNKGAGLLVVQTVSTDNRHIQQAVKSAVPVVYLGEAVNPAAETGVLCDSYKGGMLAAKILWDGGCKTAAVFTWGQAASAQYECVRGFLAFMREQNIVPEVYSGGKYLSEDAGRTMAHQMMEKQRAHGVFATHDLIAAGALQAFREVGLHLPKDLQLVGYGNHPFSELSLLEITTVALPNKELAIAAANLCADLLTGNESCLKKLTVEPYPVLRKTTRPLKKL